MSGVGRDGAPASAASAAALSVIAADPLLGARIERALATEPLSGPVVVTTDVTGVAALRAAAPAARVLVVGVRRAQVAAALDAGADAVLAGPLRPAELRARVRVLARRAETRWTMGALVLDTRARVALLDGADLGLPRREFALLCCLASAPGSRLLQGRAAAQLLGSRRMLTRAARSSGKRRVCAGGSAGMPRCS